MGGYIHSCPTNLGTGMRASVHVDLPGWTKDSVDALKARCDGMGLQPRGTRGESGGQTGHTYDISNKHRLGYSEVQLVQTMIMVSTPSGRRILNCKRSTACKFWFTNPNHHYISIPPCKSKNYFNLRILITKPCLTTTTTFEKNKSYLLQSPNVIIS